MPPSAPAINKPGTLVWKSGLTIGSSTPWVSVPNNQRDGVRGTGSLAGAMADAARGLEQLGPNIDNAEHGVFGSNLRTSANAGAAAQTLQGVDQGI